MYVAARAFAILLTALIAGSFCPATHASNPPATKNDQHEAGSIRFVHQWRETDDKGESVNLEARIVCDRPNQLGGLLQVFQDNKLIFSYDCSLFPESMFTLDDGNLATLWTHGDGARGVNVFAYSHGRVRPVIEAVEGKMRPEFVFQPTGHIMGELVTDKNGAKHDRGGPYFQQRIIIPSTDWKTMPKPYNGSKVDYLPITADIYTWDAKAGKYEVRRKIPWSQRLRNL